MIILTKEQAKFVIRSNRGKSYTYVLFNNKNEPFYVGVGIRGRVFNHECPYNLKNCGNKHKVNTINRELESNGYIRYGFILLHNDRIECLKQESLFVSKFKRAQCGGILTNLTDGGEIGPSGFKYDEEQLRYRTEINRNNSSKISIGVKEYFKNNPDAKQKLVEHLSRVRFNEKARESLSKVVKARWADPEYKKRLSDIQKKSQLPLAEDRRKDMKLKWADPEFREMMLEARRIARQKRKQGQPA